MADKTIAEYKADWNTAKAAYDSATTQAAKDAAQKAMDAAHTGANTVRSTQYGYTADASGSNVEKVTDQAKYNSYVSGNSSSANKQSSAGTDYSSYEKYDATLLPSSITYGGGDSNPYKNGGQSNLTSEQYAKYGATTDVSANSNLWWQANNDETLNDSQRAYIQNMLHEANQQLLNGSATYNKSTGTWTDNSGNQVNVINDVDKNSYVADPNRNASTIDYTYKDGKYYYNGQVITPVEFMTAEGTHIGEAFVINGEIYIKQGDNWTAAPVSSLTNTTGKSYAIFDGTNKYIIGDDEWASFTPQETEEEETTKKSSGGTYSGNGTVSYITNNSGSTDTGDSTKTTTDKVDFFDSEIYKYLSEQLETGKQAAIDANTAATEQSVLEIQAQLENGLAEYETSAADAFLKMKQNQDNLVLQNAAAGNTGGIAQKQYGYAQSSYDGQLLTIALERQYFINTCNQTIAQLEAEGRYNEANIISEWAQEKIEVINQAYEFYEQQALAEAEFEYEKYSTDRAFAYTRALTLLENGMLTADVVEALGVSASDAQTYANRINALADINIEAAEAELQSLYLSNQLAEAELNGYSASGSGNGSYTLSDYLGNSLLTDDNPAGSGTLTVSGYTDLSGNLIYIDSSNSLVYGNGSNLTAGTVITDGTNSYIINAYGGVDDYNLTTDDSKDNTVTKEPTKTSTGSKQKSDYQSANTGLSWDATKDWVQSGKSLIEYIKDGGYTAADSSTNFYNATDGTHNFSKSDRQAIYAATQQVADDDYAEAANRLQTQLSSSQIYALGKSGLVEYFGLWASDSISNAADVAKTLVDDYNRGTITYSQASTIADLLKAKSLFTSYARQYSKS